MPRTAAPTSIVGAPSPTSRPGVMSALVALTVVLTLDLLRSFPVLVVWQLGEPWRLPVSSVVVAMIAPFLGAALLLVVVGHRAPRLVFVASGLVLASARVTVQIAEGSAGAAAAGTGLLAGLALVSVLALMGLPLFGGGVVAGVLLDAVLHAAVGTRSLVWIDASWVVGLVLALAVWHAVLLVGRSRRAVVVHGRSWPASLPLVVVGPVLLVEAFLLGNLGWVSTALGGGWVLSAVVVAAAGAGGVAAAAATARSPWRVWVLGPAGAVAVMVTAWASNAPGPWWALGIVVAQVGVGSTLTAVSARGIDTGGSSAPVVALAVGHGVLLASITTLDGRGVLGLPVTPTTTTVVIGAVLGAASVLAALQRAPRPHRPGRAQLPSLAAVFVLPAVVLVAGAPALVGSVGPVGASREGTVRVVTYNVQIGFGVDGRPAIEPASRTLAALDADVIGLQEVPRGFLPTGGTDMVGWLQRSLDMPYVAFQPSSPGSLHGNAIISRHPIRSVEVHELERRGTALPRGALAAVIDVPGIGEVVVISAHLPPGGTPGQRADRVALLLDAWGERERTVIAADLNSQPGSDILRGLSAAGLESAWDDADGPGHTYPADEPRARIDWILHSPDLTAADTRVVSSRASDHLPVVSDLSPLENAD
ncbi:MAG: endonuclease/exonuclease/phosphatase family protein [Acidimicrobiales bacterium]